MFSVFSHEYYMKAALAEAQQAAAIDEIPVGAVVVCQQQIIARAHNQTERLKDVIDQCEQLALTAVRNHFGSLFL